MIYRFFTALFIPVVILGLTAEVHSDIIIISHTYAFWGLVLFTAVAVAAAPPKNYLDEITEDNEL